MSAKRRPKQLRALLPMIATGGVVLAVGLVLWKGRDVYRVIKQVRAERILPSTAALVSEGKWDAALREMNVAFRLAPEHPPIVRAMAKLLESGRRDYPTVLILIDRLEHAGALTPADRLIRARIFVSEGRFDEATNEAEIVLSTGIERAAALGVLAQVALGEGRQQDAEELLAQAVEADPNNFTLRLGFAITRGKSDFPEVRAAAGNDLWMVAQEPTLEGLRALSVLGGEFGVPSGKERKYMQLLRVNPFSEDRHRLEALRINLQIEPAERAQILSAELNAWKKRSVIDQLMFYSWLLDINHPEVVIEGLDPKTAKGHPELFRVYIGALLDQGRWEQAEKALAEEGVPLGQGQLHFVRANLAHEAGNSNSDVRGELRRAVEFAMIERFPGLALQAGEMAESLGFSEIAEAGFRGAMRSPMYAVAGTRRLAALARRSGDIEMLLDTVREGRGGEFEREEIYLKLLLGMEIEFQAVRASEGYLRDPNSAEWHLAAALGAWRLVERERARALAGALENTLGAAGLNVGKRAILAGILGRPLKVDEVQQDASEIGLESLLLPAEEAFPSLP